MPTCDLAVGKKFWDGVEILSVRCAATDNLWEIDHVGYFDIVMCKHTSPFPKGNGTINKKTHFFQVSELLGQLHYVRNEAEISPYKYLVQISILKMQNKMLTRLYP